MFSWYATICFSAMNGLSTEYINSCARQLGAKRLRFELPWEQSPLDDILSSGKKSTIQKPDWVEFPVQLWGPVSTANKPTRLDRYNARTHLSDISWVAVEAQLGLAVLEGDRVGQHQPHSSWPVADALH